MAALHPIPLWLEADRKPPAGWKRVFLWWPRHVCGRLRWWCWVERQRASEEDGFWAGVPEDERSFVYRLPADAHDHHDSVESIPLYFFAYRCRHCSQRFMM